MTIIQADLRLNLLVAGEASLPVPATFAYDTDQPLSIQATFHAAGDTIEWVFSRELMDAGLGGDAGLGDVRMWPGKVFKDADNIEVEVLYISLNSPEGQALMECDHATVKAFLDQTYELVPTGTEVIDMDAVLMDLLS